MKHTFFTIAMLIGMIGNAQQYVYGYQWKTVSFILNTDSNPTQTHIYLHDANDSLIFEGYGVYADTVNIWQVALSGQYTVTVDDAGCNGINSNGLVIIDDYSSYVVPITGCQTTFEFYVYLRDFEVEVPAPTCPTDLNHDGITSVDDLLIFISEYGNTCD